MTRAPLLVALLLVACASGASAASVTPDVSGSLGSDECKAGNVSCLNNVYRVRSSQSAGTTCTVDDGKVVCSNRSG